MTEQSVFIDIKDSKGRVDAGELILREDNDVCVLEFVFKGKLHSVTAEDFFEALVALRIQFEPDGYRFQCNGACRNVYPSRMQRDMARGRRAYLMQEGQAAHEMVSIFDHNPALQPVTVEEQQQFYEQWLQSL